MVVPLFGSLALSGGHGTTIAWAPLIATEHDFPAAMETGIAVATLGLIIACVAQCFRHSSAGISFVCQSSQCRCD
jgi:sodium--glutamate symport carrier gltS